LDTYSIFFGNISTHKLYINGNLIGTGANAQTITANLNVSFGQNFNHGYLRGYGQDMRLYNRELSEFAVLSLYEI
jgi:hypothetical protein